MYGQIRPHQFRGIFTDGKHVYTESIVPGTSVYGEILIKQKGIEYRRWEPYRSKLAALIRKGCKIFPFDRKNNILYLGAASGTTVSHISDIAKDGTLYCIEMAKIPFQKFLYFADQRKNIIPIMADASFPERYRHIVPAVDVIYQDIAQRDQIWIFRKNLNFLKYGGIGIIMIKARSIDVAIEPREIYKKTENDFKNSGLDILEILELAPFEKDHAALVIRKK